MTTFWMEALLAAGLGLVVVASVPALLSLRAKSKAPHGDASASSDITSALGQLQEVVAAEEQAVRRLSPNLPDATLRTSLAKHVEDSRRLLQQVRRAVGSILS
jgi:hypothetical protein